jgi:homoserine kinase type II
VAVYTDVPAEELDAFLAGYDIGKLLSYKGIAEGVQNSNFLLHTDAGYFILTLYERLVAVEDLPFFVALMEHLALRGINCPQPVRMRDGHTLGELCGRAAAIVTFLDGVWMRRVEPRHCAAVGEALARLHLAGADFTGHRLNALAATKLRPLFESCADRIDTIQPGMLAAILSELDFLEREWPSGLPEGVIHADLFPDNVFFLGDRLSGLIDFYFACNDMLAYDVAICLNAWCFENDHSYNVTKGRALLQGYAKVRPLTDEELAAMPLLARGAALRFLATRVVDWLNAAGIFPQAALPSARQERSRLRRRGAGTRVSLPPENSLQ